MDSNLWPLVILIPTSTMSALRTGRAAPHKVTCALEIIGQSAVLLSESSLHLFINITIVTLLLIVQLHSRLLTVDWRKEGPDIWRKNNKPLKVLVSRCPCLLLMSVQLIQVSTQTSRTWPKSHKQKTPEATATIHYTPGWPNRTTVSQWPPPRVGGACGNRQPFALSVH